MLPGGDCLAEPPLAAFSPSSVGASFPVRVPTVDARGSAYRGFSYAYVGQPPVNAFPPTLIRSNMRQGTQDYRGVSYWQILQDDGSYIASVSRIDVTRMDGQAMGPDDLTITPSGNGFVTYPWTTVDPAIPAGRRRSTGGRAWGLSRRPATSATS